MSEVHFRLLGRNGFQVKAENERFVAAVLRCRQNLKYENFTSSFGRLRQKIAPKGVPLVQHDYFSSFNQSNHWFVVLTLPLQSSFLKLPIILRTQRLSVMIRYSDSFASAHQQRQGVLQYLEFQSGCSGFKSRYDHWLVVLSLVYSCFLQAEVLCFAVIHCETLFLFVQIVKEN